MDEEGGITSTPQMKIIIISVNNKGGIQAKGI